MSVDVQFPPETDNFYDTLKVRIDSYFHTSGKTRNANYVFYIKAFSLIGIYISLYFILLVNSNINVAFISYILMGPMAIIIGINVAHDAAHKSISKKPFINSLFLHLFDLLGSNSYMWKMRHVFSHHLFPNILNKDADLKQNPMVRIFPNDKILPAHRFQFIYAPFLYLLYTINWLFFRDYQDFFAKEIGSLKLEKHEKIEIIKLISFKLFYIFYILFLPIYISNLSWGTVILGFLLMNFCASLLITLALIPSHVAENSNFLLPDEKGIMPHPWSHHQVLSVIDFATDNWFLNFLFGGFNHHVVHHLFPNINHLHSVHLTPIIKQTAQEFGISYNYEPSFLNAYASHFRLLKNNGIQPVNN